MVELIYVPGATTLHGMPCEHFTPSSPFVSNGVQYAGVVHMSPEQLADAGVMAVEVGATPDVDVRHYSVSQVLSGATATFSAELKPLRDVLSTKFLDLEAQRWHCQVAGIVVDGVRVPTDDKTVVLLTLANICAVASIQFKSDSGFSEWTAEQVTSVLDAINAHIQECFVTEALHATALKAMTSAEEVVAYDITTGWPV